MRNIALMLALAATPAAAQVARFEMEAPSPAYAGASFGAAGAYELVRGRATIALDPADPRNAVIADIALAPRHAAGRVEAVADVLILRPTDPARANGTLLVEPPNRGRQIIGQLLNDAPGASNGRYATAADAGHGWMFRQGYTLAWIGWQGDPTPGQGMRVQVPRVPNVTGPVRDEFVFDNTTNPAPGQLTYELADPASLRVTTRSRTEDARATPAGLSVAVTAPGRISITRPEGFAAGDIYEVTYTARDPGVMGMGFAAFRDVATALRHGEAPGNPQAGRASARAVTLGVSQSGRFLRDALYLGFNEDTAGRQVFDAMVPHIPGARRTDMNARWAQPGRNPSDHTDRLYPADQFPFTYADTTDPLSGVTDGLLRRCTERRNCPRIMQTDSEFEYWGARGSLTVTDAAGRHVALPANVRAYMFTGHPHYATADAWANQGRLCAMPLNPLQAGAPMRALMVALEAWMREGVEPPASRTPSVADGTLRASGLGAPGQRITGFPFPALPGLVAPDSLTPAPRLDLTTLPPHIIGSYPVLVPTLDADGNAVAGIRLPVIAAPRATYTGFNPRAAGFGAGALCTNQGAVLPLAATRAEREARNDPRPSIAERWPDQAAYVAAVRASAARLVAERLLLAEDAAAMVAAASAGTLARLR
jgi:hypothetical protein